MSIGVADYVKRYTTVTDTFQYTWLITDDDDLAVYDNTTLLVKGTHYSVTGVGAEGGNVVLETALTSGHTLTIVNKPALLQSLSLSVGGDFSALGIMAGFDRLYNVAKMFREMFDRVPMLPITESGPISLQALTGKAGYLLRVNDDEDGFELVLPGDVDDFASVTFPLSLLNGGLNGDTAAEGRTTLEAQPALKGSDVASAQNITLGEGSYFVVTGATTIETLSTKPAGTLIVLRFSGASVMTHSASLVLLGATDFTPAAGDVMLLVSDGSGAWREIWRRPTTDADASHVLLGNGTFGSPDTVPVMAGHLFGLTLSNNGADATNDIDIALGEAASDDAAVADRVLMDLTAGITKRLDAAWAVGSGNGGLDTGSIANDVYHVFLIQRSDTGVVDVLFSASATSPTMPTDYDKKRRIGAIIRSGATILAFVQFGDEFLLKDPPLDANNVALGTSAALQTLTVPDGVKVTAIVDAAFSGNSTSGILYLSSPDANDEAPSATAAPLNTIRTVDANVIGAGHLRIRTNTSAQIRARGSAASQHLYIATLGWVDTRGRFA